MKTRIAKENIDIELLFDDGTIEKYCLSRETDQSESDMLTAMASEMRYCDKTLAAARIGGTNVVWIGHQTAENYLAMATSDFAEPRNCVAGYSSIHLLTEQTA